MAVDYWDLIARRNLEAAIPGPQLEKQLLDFMTEAEHIHFNLDGVLNGLDKISIDKLVTNGNRGTRFFENVTRWEFAQVWTKFRSKTTFYFNGKPVDLSNLR